MRKRPALLLCYILHALRLLAEETEGETGEASRSLFDTIKASGPTVGMFVLGAFLVLVLVIIIWQVRRGTAQLEDTHNHSDET